MFLNVLAGILNEYAMAAAMDTFTASKSDKHPTDLAMLRGARLVTATETEEGRAWAESRIKQLTGGDPITARFMRRDFFTFRPAVQADHSSATTNRCCATWMRPSAPLQHRSVHAASRTSPTAQLEEKLKAEWPGILRWMIEGCLDWQTNGLVRPRASRRQHALLRGPGSVPAVARG